MWVVNSPITAKPHGRMRFSIDRGIFLASEKGFLNQAGSDGEGFSPIHQHNRGKINPNNGSGFQSNREEKTGTFSLIKPPSSPKRIFHGDGRRKARVRKRIPAWSVRNGKTVFTLVEERPSHKTEAANPPNHRIKREVRRIDPRETQTHGIYRIPQTKGKRRT